VSRVGALAEARAELVWHPQCFLSDGHFAGPDAARAEALIELANDPAIDAIWFARGGYGACRIVDRVIDALGPAARDKVYFGYSDPGTLLGALYAQGVGTVAHGPMPADIRREGGEAAVARALDWLVGRSPSALEPFVGSAPTAAFNIVILAHLVGTRHLPDLTGHVLMIEEVAEYLYRTDRDLAQIVQHPSIQSVAGIRMGRISQIPDNDPDFGAAPEAVVREWCERANIPFLGTADIGHDVGNKVVPFGRLPQP
jgi:muramoyltetrapeptide carboxypeptidase